MHDDKKLTSGERWEISTVIEQDAGCLSTEEQGNLSRKLVDMSVGVAARTYQQGRCTGMQDAYEIVFNHKIDTRIDAGFDSELSDGMEAEAQK